MAEFDLLEIATYATGLRFRIKKTEILAEGIPLGKSDIAHPLSISFILKQFILKPLKKSLLFIFFDLKSDKNT